LAEAIDWDWINRHLDDIQQASIQHLELVTISVVIAVAISVPLGILVRGRRVPYAAITIVGGVLYTIPSLALFAFLVPSLGIGRGPVIVGLVIYSILILVRNTVVGLEGVAAPVREAARGMGLTSWQTLRKVDLPLALPSIMAGIRVTTVSAVGIATIGVLVGAGGLGELIYNDGINRDLFLTPIVVGAVIATAMAVVLDLLLLGAEWALRPWARARAARG
jgi:osmoprotectant transport system permease protein